MLSFVLKRLGLLIPTFFGITLITFGLIRMIPGDPVEVMMGERRVDPVMHAGPGNSKGHPSAPFAGDAYPATAGIMPTSTAGQRPAQSRSGHRQPRPA